MSGTKTVTCAITGESISKRKSVQIVHEGQAVRVKRELPEVGQYLAKVEEDRINKANFATMNHNMAVLTFSSFIRVQNTVNPLFSKALFLYNLARKHGNKLKEDVEEELGAKDRLTPDEIAEAIITRSALLGK